MNNSNNEDKNTFNLPYNLNDKIPSNKTFFITSVATTIISYLIIILGINNIDLTYKIIICLGITCFILLVNIVVLYVKERENYYHLCYLNNVSQLLNKYAENIFEENKILKEKISSD